jgi:hypothetical protein
MIIINHQASAQLLINNKRINSMPKAEHPASTSKEPCSPTSYMDYWAFQSLISDFQISKGESSPGIFPER